MVGRMCLAVTITLAFPMLVIPGRDICVRSILLPRLQQNRTSAIDAPELAEPLLENDDEEMNHTDTENTEEPLNLNTISFGVLLSISVVIFWSAALLASLVSSIDVVWDLLGSSLSILMSYLIPAGTYLVIANKQRNNISMDDDDAETSWKDTISRMACWLLLIGSVPLMVVSTANAVYNTFLKH